MKKKSMAWLLTAALCATSFAPVYGAEFTCAPEEETVELFQSGEVAEPEANVEEEGPTELFQYEEEGWGCEVALRIVKEPERTHFAHKAQVRSAEDIVLGDFTVELYKTEDGTILDTETINSETATSHVYSLDFYKDGEWIDPYYDELSVGEYEVQVIEEFGAKASFKIYVDSPETLIPEMEKIDDVRAESTQAVDQDFKEAYVRFVPERTGYYFVDAECNKGTGELRCVSMDDDYVSFENGKVRLEQGKDYYFVYKVDNYTPGMNVHFSLQEEEYIIEMEWVEKPSKPLYSGIDTWSRNENNRHSARVSDGKVNVIYSDGTEEVLSLKDMTKTGRGFENYFIYAGTGDAKPGTYTTVFTTDITDSSVPTLTADLVIKSQKELPTIKNKGKQTVPFETPYVRFETGAGTEYKMSINVSGKPLGIHVRNSKKWSHCVNNSTITLAPNTAYYLLYSGNITGSPKNITYTVTPAKVSISKCNFEVSKTAVYTGKTIRPKVKVFGHDSDVQLKENRDYTITYSNNKNVGNASIKITGKGSYTGSKTLSFTITPGKSTIKTAKRSSKGPVSLTWSKAAGASGYVVARSTNGKTWTKVATVKSTSFTDKKAKKGTAYQYKVRSYKKVGKKTIYGSFSSVKKVK